MWPSSRRRPRRPAMPPTGCSGAWWPSRRSWGPRELVPIAKGGPYGAPGPFPGDGVVVGSDAEARQVVEAARRERRPPPVLGLVGGALFRTLGGSDSGKRRGDGEARLRTEGGVVFSVDLGEVLLDGRLHFFVAH